uniref:Molybdenum cofactor sulfurase n=2 Tax=Trichuris muris TaxID=70415 RepID=A0A5S6Q7F6_TRIMR
MLSVVDPSGNSMQLRVSLNHPHSFSYRTYNLKPEHYKTVKRSQLLSFVVHLHIRLSMSSKRCQVLEEMDLNSTAAPVETYLDHAAATEFTDDQVQAFLSDLAVNRYGNPHSLNSRGLLTAARVDQIRQRILNHFGTTSEHYAVVFTSNCSAALKMVAESFIWTRCELCKDGSGENSGDRSFFSDDWYKRVRIGGPCLMYTQDNHTSVVGMRMYALKQNVAVYVADEKSLTSSMESADPNQTSVQCDCSALFVYPGQSNFCGRRYPLEWSDQVRGGALGPQRWYICLDAAALAPTRRLHLGDDGPDFVGISFYKMFGFPTGLGALLVLRRSANVLKRPYFGGGTAKIYSSTCDYFHPRDEIEKKFEDGTLAYQLVIALKHGFDEFEKAGGIDIVGQRVFQLAKRAYDGLLNLRHHNGTQVARVYCESKFRSPKEQGGTVAFNLTRSNGRWVGFSEVDRMARAYDIQLRAGCFCNQGACQLAFGLTDSQAMSLYQEDIKRCGDQVDIVNGIPLGAVRISLGWTSVDEDVSKFLAFIEECFVEKAPLEELNHNFHRVVIEESQQRELELEKIFVYPIKSCRPVEITDQWPLGKHGLWLDRKWMMTDSYGVPLKLDRNAALSEIHLVIDLSKLWLFDGKMLKRTWVPISMPCVGSHCARQYEVCNRKEKADDCGDRVALWLDEVLKSQGTRLVQSSSSEHGLTNQAQYLLLNRASIRRLLEEMQRDTCCRLNEEDLIARFRANLVIQGAEPFEEETWNQVRIGSVLFNCVGRCQRCAVIAVDPKTGAKAPDIVKHLRMLRGNEFTFGVYLEAEEQQGIAGSLLRVGDAVVGIV